MRPLSFNSGRHGKSEQVSEEAGPASMRPLSFNSGRDGE